jgi:hypothetical protein
MKSAVLILVVCASCALPEPDEHCMQSCRFYSNCSPELEPLEEMCVTSCQKRFADPMQIVADCTTAEPRHPVDSFRGLPSLQVSAIEAGQCAIDQGCPPDMPDPDAQDPCAGIERICVDTLTAQQLCSRTYDIDTFVCSEAYQDCVDRGEDISICSGQSQSCYESAYRKFEPCYQGP